MSKITVKDLTLCSKYYFASKDGITEKTGIKGLKFLRADTVEVSTGYYSSGEVAVDAVSFEIGGTRYYTNIEDAKAAVLEKRAKYIAECEKALKEARERYLEALRLYYVPSEKKLL